MKFFVEMAVELPEGHGLKRNTSVGDLKVRRLHKPNPRNVEAGFRPYDIAEIDGKIGIDGKMDATGTTHALSRVVRILQELDLDEKAMIDLCVYSVD